MIPFLSEEERRKGFVSEITCSSLVSDLQTRSSTAGPVVSTATPATLQPSVAAGSCLLGLCLVQWGFGGFARLVNELGYITVDHGRCVGLACTNSIPFV
jgi:hypothetical protein